MEQLVIGAGSATADVVTGDHLWRVRLPAFFSPRPQVVGRRLPNPSSFVNPRPANGRVQANGLHGSFVAIVPVEKAAPITDSRDAKSRQRPSRAGPLTGGSKMNWNRNCRQHTAGRYQSSPIACFNLVIRVRVELLESLGAVTMQSAGREDRALLRSNPSARSGLCAKGGRLRPSAHFFAPLAFGRRLLLTFAQSNRR